MFPIFRSDLRGNETWRLSSGSEIRGSKLQEIVGGSEKADTRTEPNAISVRLLFGVPDF